MEQLRDELLRIVFESSFMTLATSDADRVPWATPVEYSCDEELRFYWTSLVSSRHSQNIRANPRIGAVIFDSNQLAGVTAEVQALYVEGGVEELRPEQQASVRPGIRRWLDWHAHRRAAPPPAPDLAPQAEPEVAPPAAESPWRTYRLTPTRMYALDPAGHPDEPGVRVWRADVDLRASFRQAYRARR